MFEKAPGKFMADWTDVDGRRKRKQFTRAIDAQRYEHEQRALRHAERARRELDNASHHVERGKRERLAKRAASVLLAARTPSYARTT